MIRRPLVLNQGVVSELPEGDSVVGTFVPATYMQVPVKVSVQSGSSFRISSGAGVRVFMTASIGSGFSVFNRIVVEAGSRLRIETNSSGTVLGE